MKYAWCSDIHLDHMRDEQHIIAFVESIVDEDIDGVFLTGDIANGTCIDVMLELIASATQRPVYFVLGNHDFYGSSIGATRAAMLQLRPLLTYMSSRPFVRLSDKTGLVGHDGWYDFLYNDYYRIVQPSGAEMFALADWTQIEEFKAQYAQLQGQLPNYKVAAEISGSLAQEGATHVVGQIKAAVKAGCSNITVLTHIPPFKEASRYQDRPSPAYSLPLFSSKIMGDMLLECYAMYPHIKFDVLCGHTHDAYDQHVRKNMRCRVMEAEYRYPRVQYVEVV